MFHTSQNYWLEMSGKTTKQNAFKGDIFCDGNLILECIHCSCFVAISFIFFLPFSFILTSVFLPESISFQFLIRSIYIIMLIISRSSSYVIQTHSFPKCTVYFIQQRLAFNKQKFNEQESVGSVGKNKRNKRKWNRNENGIVKKWL